MKSLGEQTYHRTGIRSIGLFIAVICITYLPLRAQEPGITRTPITFESGRFTLHGQLVMPDTAQHAPVLVFLPGIGREASYRTTYRAFIRQNLEQLFLEEGIGLLYFDKRGIGDSEGRWQRMDMYERAGDAMAAIDFLKTQGRIDHSRIGVVGHEQGGSVGLILADTLGSDLKLVAALATPTYDTQLHLTNQYYTNFRCAGDPDSVAFDRARKKAISDINWVSWFPLTKDWRQLRELREFDPSRHLQNTKLPLFLAFAENDPAVYPGWAIAALGDIFGDDIPENFNLQIIPAANHYLRIQDRCVPIGTEQTGPFSSYFQVIFKDWILSNLK